MRVEGSWFGDLRSMAGAPFATGFGKGFAVRNSVHVGLLVTGKDTGFNVGP